MLTFDDALITQDEMIALFGEAMPINAVQLLFGSDGSMTVGEMRAALRKMAVETPFNTPPPVNRGEIEELARQLREEAQDWRDDGVIPLADLLERAAHGLLTQEETLLRVHPNPADYRYWEGRYRDEVARAEAAEQRVKELESELDALSNSHRDLASRLARKGEREAALVAALEEAGKCVHHVEYIALTLPVGSERRKELQADAAAARSALSTSSETGNV